MNVPAMFIGGKGKNFTQIQKKSRRNPEKYPVCRHTENIGKIRKRGRNTR
jgi:hypothetical protein